MRRIRGDDDPLRWKLGGDVPRRLFRQQQHHHHRLLLLRRLCTRRIICLRICCMIHPLLRRMWVYDRIDIVTCLEYRMFIIYVDVVSTVERIVNYYYRLLLFFYIKKYYLYTEIIFGIFQKAGLKKVKVLKVLL